MVLRKRFGSSAKLSRLAWLVVFSLCLGLCSAAHSNEVVLRTIEGLQIKGQLREVDAAGNLTIDAPESLGFYFPGVHGTEQLTMPEGVAHEPNALQVNLSQLSALEFPRAEAPQPPVHQMLIVGGGRLNASRLSLSREVFSVESSGQSFEIPAESVLAVYLQPQVSSPLFERMRNSPSTDSDLVIAQTSQGDQTVAGIVEEITEDRLRILVDGQSRTIARTRVIGIIPADLGHTLDRETVSLVHLADGSSWSGRVVGLENGRLRLAILPRGGSEIQLDATSITSMQVRSSRVEYVSDKKETEAWQQPLVTLDFPWQRDLSASGGPLKLYAPSTGKLVTFDKGLGSHAEARWVVANNGSFARLIGIVGIDPATQGRGNCVVRVEADGTAIWSGKIRGDADPIYFNLDISSARQVAFVVLAGENFDLGDHVNWCDLRMIRTED